VTFTLFEELIVDEDKIRSRTKYDSILLAASSGGVAVLAVSLLLGGRSGPPVVHIFVAALAALSMAFWGFEGSRCARALTELKTTVFYQPLGRPYVFTRFPPILVYGSWALIFFFIVHEFDWLSALAAFFYSTSVLSFTAIAAGALDLHEGREPFMFVARFAHGMGGVFGTIVAHFTFRGHPVLDRTSKTLPTLLLALIVVIGAPFMLRFALNNTLITKSSEIEADRIRLHDAEIVAPDGITTLAPLDGLTGQRRLSDDTRSLTKQEFELLTKRYPRERWGLRLRRPSAAGDRD
jgi:hypothetical protein